MAWMSTQTRSINYVSCINAIMCMTTMTLCVYITNRRKIIILLDIDNGLHPCYNMRIMELFHSTQPTSGGLMAKKGKKQEETHGDLFYEFFHKGKKVAEITIDDNNDVWFHYIYGEPGVRWIRVRSIEYAMELTKLWKGEVPNWDR